MGAVELEYTQHRPCYVCGVQEHWRGRFGYTRKLRDKTLCGGRAEDRNPYDDLD